MNHITINERREMKYMGYAFRAWYLSPFGIPFHKDFHTAEEMDAFNRSAQEVGTKILEFVGL